MHFLLIFKTGMLFLSGIIEYFCVIARHLPNITRLVSTYQNNQRGRCLQTPCSHLIVFPYFLCFILYFVLYCALCQPSMSLFDILGMRLNNQLLFWWIFKLLRLSFNMLWIIIIWCEVQLAGRNVLQRDISSRLHLKYISETASSYFYLSKEVESVLLFLPES